MSRTEIEIGRFRGVLDRLPRRVLAAVSLTATGRSVAATARKGAVIDTLVAMPPRRLERALAAAVTVQDLKALCERLGYSGNGSKNALAARVIAAIEDPSTPIARWRSFRAARAFARSLDLRGQAEWFVRVHSGQLRLPADIPRAPHLVYAAMGWTSWGDFLGTNNPARHLMRYRPFTEARAYTRSLGLSTASDWRAHARRRVRNRRILPADIPSAPHHVYRHDGWVSYGDWLGTRHVHSSKIRFRNYRAARAFVRSLGIRTEPEWRAYCRGETHRETPRPLDVPTNPHRTYRGKGWTSWGDFFGTGSVAPTKRAFRAYAAARDYVRRHGPTNSREWRAWSRSGQRPRDIPAAPDHVYAEQGWRSWQHFLGSPRRRSE